MGCGGIIQILSGNQLLKKVEQKLTFNKSTFRNPPLEKVEPKLGFL